MLADVFNLILDTWARFEMYNNLPKVIYLSFKLAPHSGLQTPDAVLFISHGLWNAIHILGDHLTMSVFLETIVLLDVLAVDSCRACSANDLNFPL